MTYTVSNIYITDIQHPVYYIINCHMSFYTCFDWFKKLRLFSYVLNVKNDVVLIRRFSSNEAPLGLFKFISDYLPYFEKKIDVSISYQKKFELNYKDWSKLFVRFFRNNLADYTVCIPWLMLFLHEPNNNCNQSLIVLYIILTLTLLWNIFFIAN
jgi:hypothetical protein